MSRASKCDEIVNPKLPRRRNTFNYCSLVNNPNVEGYSSGNVGHHPLDVKSHYRRLYYEAIDTLIENMHDRFNQDTMSLLEHVEDFFVYCLKDVCNLYSPVHEEKIRLPGMNNFLKKLIWIV